MSANTTEFFGRIYKRRPRQNPELEKVQEELRKRLTDVQESNRLLENMSNALDLQQRND